MIDLPFHRMHFHFRIHQTRRPMICSTLHHSTSSARMDQASPTHNRLPDACFKLAKFNGRLSTPTANETRTRRAFACATDRLQTCRAPAELDWCDSSMTISVSRGR
jgi:hypothetical protein